LINVTASSIVTWFSLLIHIVNPSVAILVCV
jgi:hypothetical protein